MPAIDSGVGRWFAALSWRRMNAMNHRGSVTHLGDGGAVVGQLLEAENVRADGRIALEREPDPHSYPDDRLAVSRFSRAVARDGQARRSPRPGGTDEDATKPARARRCESGARRVVTGARVPRGHCNLPVSAS